VRTSPHRLGSVARIEFVRMEITYLPEKQDFIDAQLAHAWRKYSPGAKKTQRILEPVLGLGLLWLAYHLASSGANGAVVFVEAILGLYVLLASSVISPFFIQRAYDRRRPVTLSSVTWTVDAESLRCSKPGSGRSELQWSVIRGFLDRPATLLLYTAPGVFLYFPKRVLSEAQQGELLGLLQGNDVPPTYPR
jgi:hypothetical protein